MEAQICVHVLLVVYRTAPVTKSLCGRTAGALVLHHHQKCLDVLCYFVVRWLLCSRYKAVQRVVSTDDNRLHSSQPWRNSRIFFRAKKSLKTLSSLDTHFLNCCLQADARMKNSFFLCFKSQKILLIAKTHLSTHIFQMCISFVYSQIRTHIHEIPLINAANHITTHWMGGSLWGDYTKHWGNHTEKVWGASGNQ